MSINKILFGQNEKGEANKGTSGEKLLGLIIVALILTYFFNIWPFSGKAKYGEFYTQDKNCILSLENDDKVIWIMTYSGYNSHGDAIFQDASYGSLMAATLSDGTPLVAEWHSNSNTWIVLDGNGYWGTNGTITLYKNISSIVTILKWIIFIIIGLLLLRGIITLFGLKLLLLIIILVAGSVTFFNYRKQKTNENELTQSWESLSESLPKVSTSDNAISELLSIDFSLQNVDSIPLRPCSILTDDSISVYFYMKAGTKYSSPDLQDSEEHQLGRDCPFTFKIKDFISASQEDIINGSLGAAHTQFKKKEISIDLKQTKIASTVYWKNAEGEIVEYQVWLVLDDYLRVFGNNQKAEVDKILAKYSLLQTEDNIKSASADSALSVSSQQIVDSIYSATVIAEQTYFYDSTDVNTKRNSYIIKGQEVQVRKLFGDFLYASFDNKGIVTEGWVLKSDFENK